MYSSSNTIAYNKFHQENKIKTENIATIVVFYFKYLSIVISMIPLILLF